MPQIRLESLSFSFSKTKRPLFENLSLTFPDGSISVILGPSGAGKTTLLRCIAGLENYQGHIYYDGLLEDGVAVKDRKLSYLTQDATLYPRRTIFENIAYSLELRGTDPEEIKKRVYDLADAYGITACLSRKPKQISLGQAQRAALCKALIKNPRLLLLDEPLSHLDKPERFKARTFLKAKIKENSLTGIHVTHDVDEAFALGDYLYVLDEGKVIASGTPEEMSHSNNSIVQAFLAERGNEL